MLSVLFAWPPPGRAWCEVSLPLPSLVPGSYQAPHHGPKRSMTRSGLSGEAERKPPLGNGRV